MNDRQREEELYAEGWAKGLRSIDLMKYIRERWEPAAAVAGPEETVEEPKPVAKKKTKKKAAKK